MMKQSDIHPDLVAAIQRHREFFEGDRNVLIKVAVPLKCEDELVTAPAFDGLDWENDFEEYVRGNVENAKIRSRHRLALNIQDDSIPSYFPYFGISIHHSFFGGEVSFGGGTSYAEAVIDKAADWDKLRPDLENPWPQRLFWGLRYCRDHGDGVLFASYRGGNGPLDMANGVMGNAVYTEMFDDPDNMRRVMDVCTDAIFATFKAQRDNNSDIMGGRIVPMGGLWVPGTALGHMSLDAACLAGPVLYNEFEKEWLERITDQTGGVMIHTHMLGQPSFKVMCATKGFLVFAPADDPNQPPLLSQLDAVLADIGEVPLMLSVPSARLNDVIPKFRGRRAVINLSATDPEDARRQIQTVRRILDA